VRVLAKAGLAWRPGRWELGLTATTPGAALWGQGKATFNASATGAVTSPLVSASTQEGLDVTYHAPWSVALGASWRRGGTAIHSTAEWFSAVGEYDILQPEPAPIAGRPDVVPLRYQGQARSVVCYGIGIEQRLSDTIVFYGGAAENESAYVAQHDSFAAWDLTDVTGGLTFQTGHAIVAFGLGYAWGKSPVPQAVTPPEAGVVGALTDASFARWTISFGASFH
jgi:hypothetical protein